MDSGILIKRKRGEGGGPGEEEEMEKQDHENQQQPPKDILACSRALSWNEAFLQAAVLKLLNLAV